MTVCAWCVQEQRIADEPEASHGMCDAHVLTTFVLPRVQGVIARLAGQHYLGESMRAELTGDLQGVERVLTKMAARVTV